MRTKARIGVAALAALALLVPVQSASGADKGKTITVKPGKGTISAAATTAESGDTLRLKKGVYVDAVNFGSKAISVKGAGQGRSIIKLPSKLPPPDPDDFCRAAEGQAAGLCWVEPDGPVRVRDLTTVGHAIGILGLQMDGMRVTHTTGKKHDEYGVAAFLSHGLRFFHNTEVGDGGEAGLYIGDTGNARARVAHNKSTGWLFGLFLRDSRNGVAWQNTLAHNCAGALVLDTGPNGPQTENGETFVNFPAGKWLLVHNKVVRNTRFCPGGEEEPAIGGHGIVVVGADRVAILKNKIRGNNPPREGESAFPSSGVTIVSGEVAGSDDPAKVLVARNRMRNHLDIFWDGSGRKIVFVDNKCRTSVPAGLCG